MHHPSTRDRAAASLFGIMGLIVAALAVLVAEPVLLALAFAHGVLAVVALRGYPLDRDW